MKMQEPLHMSIQCMSHGSHVEKKFSKRGRKVLRDTSMTERLSIGQLQKWERALDIKLLDRKTLDEAWKGYVKHLGVK